MTERQDVRPLTTEDLVPGTRTSDTPERYDEIADDRVDHDRLDTDQADDNRFDDHQVDDNRVDGTYDENFDDTGDETAEPTQTAESLPPNQERAPADDDSPEGAQLFGNEEIDRFRDEWRALQADFVDSPREAVQHADELVAQVIQSLATTFADHKRSLEGQWNQGEQVDTEELRVALRRYRSFFDQLLTV